MSPTLRSSLATAGIIASCAAKHRTPAQAGRWPRGHATCKILARYFSRSAPLAAVSVTSKGQVPIPKRARLALGITRGSKVEFDLEGGGARLKLIKQHAASRVEGGPGILNYTGPRIAIEDMHGGKAMKKAGKHACR